MTSKAKAKATARDYVRDFGEASAVRAAICGLKAARDLLQAVGAPRAAAKVRKAIKSAEGAGRNVQGRRYRDADAIARGVPPSKLGAASIFRAAGDGCVTVEQLP